MVAPWISNRHAGLARRGLLASGGVFRGAQRRPGKISQGGAPRVRRTLAGRRARPCRLPAARSCARTAASSRRWNARPDRPRGTRLAYRAGASTRDHDGASFAWSFDINHRRPDGARPAFVRAPRSRPWPPPARKSAASSRISRHREPVEPSAVPTCKEGPRGGRPSARRQGHRDGRRHGPAQPRRGPHSPKR